MKTVGRLLYLRLISHPVAIFFLGFLNAFILALIARDYSIHGDLRGAMTAMVTVPLLLSFVTIGTAAFTDAMEKRTRLFTELPVSNLQVRLSFWCFILACLVVTTLVWSIFLHRMASPSLWELGQLALLFYFHAGTLAALVVLIARHLRLLQEIHSGQWKRLILRVVLTFVVFSFIGVSYDAVMEAGEPDWALLLALLLVACPALITLDLFLYERMDSHLN